MPKKANISTLEATLEDIFLKKAPSLPSNIKKAIVKYGPWIILISLIFTLPSILALFGLGTMALPFSYMMGGMKYGYSFSLNFILFLIITLLTVIALPGLFKRQRQGWNLLFYSSLVSFVQNLLSFNLGALVVGSALSWYLLFQIRSYFKK